jgi:hypothetical protein
VHATKHNKGIVESAEGTAVHTAQMYMDLRLSLYTENYSSNVVLKFMYTLGYVRTNVIDCRTSFVIASVNSSIH